MDPAGFCSQTRVLIVAGKGGVGKTTVSAALARMAALAGLTTLIVEVEGKSGLPSLFGAGDGLTYDEVVLAPGGGPEGWADVRARTLTPDDALLEYLVDHGMKRVSKRLASSGALDVVATAVPGIKDILVLGKVKQLERLESVDLIVLDAPAAGHAVTVGPIRAQAADVIDLLADPTRCQVLLVTLPEETPVNEVVETAYNLEDRVGVALAPVVVNGLYPVLEGLDADPVAVAEEAGLSLREDEARVLREAATFRRRRQELQAQQVARLAEELPLPQLHLPFLFTTDLGLKEVDLLADALATGVEALPAAATTADGKAAP